MRFIKIKTVVARILRSYGKDAFMASIPEAGSILDVGCGNNSPYKIKTIFPKVHYTGIDIGDYCQNKQIKQMNTLSLNRNVLCRQ